MGERATAVPLSYTFGCNSYLGAPAERRKFLPCRNSGSGTEATRRSSSGKDVWLNPRLEGRTTTTTTGRCLIPRQVGGRRSHERCVEMDPLLSSLSLTTTAAELHSVMAAYLPSSGRRPLSIRFIVSVLARVTDHRRSLALLDWMFDVAGYPPSPLPYNVVLRNATRAGEFTLAAGLLHEMRFRSISPDQFTYSILLSGFCRSNLLDAALSLLPLMEEDSVTPDLVLFSTLISLALRLRDPSKALAVFSRLRSAGFSPDIVAYNSLLAVLSRAGLFRDARGILADMDAAGVPPDTISYSTLLVSLVSHRRLSEALSLFHEMQSPARRLPLDLPTCNIMLDAYGQLDMPREADRLFWSMRSLGVDPSIVTYNTMLRVYGDAELFGEAIHLFRLMQRQNIEQNVVTYNTMIKIYGKTLEHEKAGNLLQEMKHRGIQPNAITHSAIISIWARAGKLHRAAKLFQKLRDSGAEIDPVLYQTMIVVYERAGFVAHARRLLHDLKEPENIDKEKALAILAKAGRIEEASWLFRRTEVKDVEVYRCLMDLFARNRRNGNVVEVFERMRERVHFPDSELIVMAMTAYGKLQEFDKAEAVYMEMEEEGCLIGERVHFQMLNLLGMRKDYLRVEELLNKLRSDPEVDDRELHLVAASVYERGNRLDDAARIMGKMKKASPLPNPLHMRDGQIRR
ncbi:hypothetical protein HPP92_019727 [Vanilla planifolia]|uniref:Pentatricopeptide repeat-containing protein n=1 Tax=Vanilla planifolia TaxID=51239 RepID=A0A835UJF6_VANPL|nr:hypothetical protein HPP92_019727 [Vanilla planifolia]